MKKFVVVLSLYLSIVAGIGGCAATDGPPGKGVYTKVSGFGQGTFALTENSSMFAPVSEEYLKNPQTYAVGRTVTVQNDSATVDNLGIWLPMLENYDSQRILETGTSSPPPAFTLHDPRSGTGMDFYAFRGEPALRASLTITETWSYTCYEVQFDIDPSAVQPYDTSDPAYDRYTRPELKIESGDLAISHAADALAAAETNPYYLARSIYDFVLDHMDYQLVEGLKGARFAFEKGYGECGDYAALFVALCRAAGIPARPVVGRFASSIEGDWHAWAEFYLPGYGWVPVDPSVADLNDLADEYFGHMTNNVLIFNKAFKVTLNPAPLVINSWYDIMQGWVWEYTGVAGEINIRVEYAIEPVPTG